MAASLAGDLAEGGRSGDRGEGERGGRAPCESVVGDAGGNLKSNAGSCARRAGPRVGTVEATGLVA